MEPPTHGSPTVSATSHGRRLRRRAKRGRKSGYEDGCSCRARTRSICLLRPQKQARRQPPFAPRGETSEATQPAPPSPRGRRRRDAGAALKPALHAAGDAVQGSSEPSFTRHTSARHRRTGEAAAPARGANRAMAGAVLSECSPEGRRSGDVGGAGSSRAVANRTRPERNGAAMIRISNSQTKITPKGRIKCAQKP